jgi:hypothetical protein
MKIADRCRTLCKLAPDLILWAPPRLCQYLNGFTGHIKRLFIEVTLDTFPQLFYVADSQELNGFSDPCTGLTARDSKTYKEA